MILRLFLRRLVDHDVISPHADRHESLAVLGAMVVSLAIFVTFFITSEYLAAFIQLPGPTALSALSDRFLFVAASMAICALAALMVWDALAVEPRDAAILGPLPIPARTVTRAKLTAALVFGSAFAVALNAVPSILYPLFLTMNLRGSTGWGVLQLIAAHAISVVLAGWFGFFAIVAARGVLRSLAGERGFRRLASPVHSALVVCAITGLLLAPSVRKTVVREWISGAAPARWPARPVLWYLGLNETLAGRVVVETPVVLPPRVVFISRLRKDDRDSRESYNALLPRFATLAPRAWISVPLIAGLAVLTFLWNNRRLPEPVTAARSSSRLRAGARRIVERLVPDGETRAGFFFTWQTLMRSPPHRTVIAIAVAAGLTHALMAVAANGMHRVALVAPPRGLLAITNVVLVTLAVGVRYAVTVPPEYAANWAIRMAWVGDARRFLTGVRAAALIMMVLLPLLLLAPLNVALFGGTIALAHSSAGLLLGVVLGDALFLTYRQAPFVCSYTPVANPKLLWPLGLTAGLFVTYGFAGIEARALQATLPTAGLLIALVAIIVGLHVVGHAIRLDAPPVDFEERPSPATQRLGLFESSAD